MGGEEPSVKKFRANHTDKGFLQACVVRIQEWSPEEISKNLPILKPFKAFPAKRKERKSKFRLMIRWPEEEQGRRLLGLVSLYLSAI